MTKKPIIDSKKSIIENYNMVFQKIAHAKTVDDVRNMVATAKAFISMYKKVDKEMVNRIYEKLQTKMHDLIDENAFMYEQKNNRIEEISNRTYDYTNAKDDSRAVQNKALQLMAQMPKVMNSNHANRITKVLNDSINTGVVGSKAVLELLKYPAYADMVSAKIRERAFEGSKSAAEQAFERLRESELREAEQALASVYMQGFHLRKMAKQVDAFKKPSNWNPDEQIA